MHAYLATSCIPTALPLSSCRTYLLTVALQHQRQITAGVALQGLEAGLLVGVILCALHFAYEYSLMQLVSLTVLPSRSHAMLPFRYQQVLALFKDHVTAVSVSGVTLTLRYFCVSDSSAHLAEPS